MVHSESTLFRIPDRQTDRQTDGDDNFNSYIQNLRVFVFQIDRQTDGWTDRQTDRQTDREINPVWASLTTFLQVKICH
jgi:hypothetical protein